MKPSNTTKVRLSAFKDYFKPPQLTYRVWKVWRRDFDVFVKTIKVNFMPPLLEPIFYLAAMGLGLGGIISPSELGGLSYIQFIAPALLAISIMNSSFFECTYGSFVRMYFQKTFDAIIATPVNIEEVIAGELLWGATRSLISSSIVAGVIAFFSLIAVLLGLSPTYYLITNPLPLLIPFVAFLAGLTFSTIAMCFTALAPNIDFFNYPAFLLITPMFLISGTFFPLVRLPGFVQIIAQVFLPLTHAVNLMRNLFFANLGSAVLLSLLWLLAVTPVFFILSVNMMRKKLIK